jgi:hypothetical protein
MASIALDPARDASFLAGSDEWRSALIEELQRSQAPLASPLEDVESRLIARLALL